MTADILHATGVLFIVFALGVAVWTMWSSIAAHWTQMRAAFLRAFTSPAASVAPHATALTPLPSVEATGEPTLSVPA